MNSYIILTQYNCNKLLAREKHRLQDIIKLYFRKTGQVRSSLGSINAEGKKLQGSIIPRNFLRVNILFVNTRTNIEHCMNPPVH